MAKKTKAKSVEKAPQDVPSVSFGNYNERKAKEGQQELTATFFARSLHLTSLVVFAGQECGTGTHDYVTGLNDEGVQANLRTDVTCLDIRDPDEAMELGKALVAWAKRRKEN